MYEYGSGSSDSSKSSSSEYRYSGPFYQDNIGSGSGHRTTLEVSEGKKKSFPRLMFKAVCVALVFGIVASVAFQATNYVGVQLRGENAAAVTGEEPAIVPEIETVAPQIGDIQRPGSGDVTAIVQECMPSLVAITNVSIREVENFWGFGWYNMPQQREQTSTGTGIVIGQNDTELLIVTNNHVIAGATNLTVLFSVDEGRDGASAVEAQIKGTDASKDVGVIAVPLKDIPAETLNEIKVATIGDSSQLQVGEQVVAIGNALGYGQSVTTGIISALNRDVTLQNDDGSLINNSLIQTDAAINPGNSGGALLNMNGEVIGINEAKYSSSYVEGVGYAIPISDVEGIIGDLKTMTIRPEVDAEKIGYLGINCQDVTEEISKQYDMPVGIYLKSVVSGCAADNAGLKRGDILTRFDGIGVSTYDSLRERLQYYEAGETVEVTVMSPENGEYVEKTVTVTLSSKEEVEAAS
ncbi:MAG: trypsin-like serine protease [Lachnospiraceae bacterium]|uniref:S1C family serine protease n=1 Tax=Candidatus Merdisoma sp. JLR.KK006 TaxID=3112626 RepID=UPI002FF09DA1|nr:trypsin-like serine protease [Lachnospiraceae bacterium]